MSHTMSPRSPSEVREGVMNDEGHAVDLEVIGFGQAEHWMAPQTLTCNLKSEMFWKPEDFIGQICVQHENAEFLSY